MKEKRLYALWVFWYVLCVILGAIPDRSGAGDVVLTIVAVLFFVPGAWLLYLGIRHDRKKTVRRIRLISILSLVLTTMAMVANLLSVRASSLVLGDVLHIVLSVVSAPMFCFGEGCWVLSLFGWACLLMVSFPWLRNSGRKC